MAESITGGLPMLYVLNDKMERKHVFSSDDFFEVGRKKAYLEEKNGEHIDNLFGCEKRYQILKVNNERD